MCGDSDALFSRREDLIAYSRLFLVQSQHLQACMLPNKSHIVLQWDPQNTTARSCSYNEQEPQEEGGQFVAKVTHEQNELCAYDRSSFESEGILHLGILGKSSGNITLSTLIKW